MTMSSQPAKHAISNSAYVSWSACSAVRPWKSRSSRKRSPSLGKKASLAVAVAASGRFPVKVVADTLGVARSHLVKKLSGTLKPRGRYQRQGDDELLAAIRQLTNARPTYGYRRITALMNRARRASGAEPITTNASFASWRRARYDSRKATSSQPVLSLLLTLVLTLRTNDEAGGRFWTMRDLTKGASALHGFLVRIARRATSLKSSFLN